MHRIGIGLCVLALLGGAGRLTARQEERRLAADFAVTMGATVRVRDTDLTIRLVRVTDDSRCPVEVQCITAGDAVVVLSVQSGRSAAAEVSLHTGLVPRDVTRGRWRIQLVDLAPAPSVAQRHTQNDYVATLRVERSR